jgi:pimeloyl-ACP methyl ester carboxylesterase
MLIREFCASVLALALTTQIVATASAADGPAGTYAEIPGVELWFTDSGGTGTPIVLLHANTGTSAVWTDQVTSFSQAGYRVIAFDRRGWGKSIANPATGPQPGSIAGDLDALADYLKLDKFHLLGVAGGGFAALDYAAWQPEKLRSLVIGASTGSISDREIADFSARIEILELRKLPAVYREVGASYRGANPDGTRRWIEIDEHSRQKDAPSQPLRTPNTFAKLDTIPTATLIVAHVKNHEWANVPDSGHAIAWEHPNVFNEKVLEFVKRH